MLAGSRKRARQLISGNLDRVLPGDIVTISYASCLANTLSFADEIIIGVLIETPGVLRVMDWCPQFRANLRMRAKFHSVEDRLLIEDPDDGF